MCREWCSLITCRIVPTTCALGAVVTRPCEVSLVFVGTRVVLTAAASTIAGVMASSGRRVPIEPRSWQTVVMLMEVNEV